MLDTPLRQVKAALVRAPPSYAASLTSATSTLPHPQTSLTSTTSLAAVESKNAAQYEQVNEIRYMKTKRTGVELNRLDWVFCCNDVTVDQETTGMIRNVLLSDQE